MPVVQKQKLDGDVESPQVSVTDGGCIHIWDLSTAGQKKKNTSTTLILWEKIRPFIGEWYIPLTDVKDALSSKAIEFTYSCCTKKKKKIRKPSEVRSGVKYRPQSAHNVTLQLHRGCRRYPWALASNHVQMKQSRRRPPDPTRPGRTGICLRLKAAGGGVVGWGGGAVSGRRRSSPRYGFFFFFFSNTERSECFDWLNSFGVRRVYWTRRWEACQICWTQWAPCVGGCRGPGAGYQPTSDHIHNMLD